MAYLQQSSGSSDKVSVGENAAEEMEAAYPNWNR